MIDLPERTRLQRQCTHSVSMLEGTVPFSTSRTAQADLQLLCQYLGAEQGPTRQADFARILGGHSSQLLRCLHDVLLQAMGREPMFSRTAADRTTARQVLHQLHAHCARPLTAEVVALG